MSIILNIDTAINTASVAIAFDGEIVRQSSNTQQKEHGSFLQPAIQVLLKESSLTIKELDAIAVSAGPGSYTGLRVGMATAKGLCFGLKKPLITVNTLEILSLTAILQIENEDLTDASLFCPMIDARRNEVYTALYDQNLQEVMAPVALLLDQNIFANTLLKNQIFFFGNGAAKWETLFRHKNAKNIDLISNQLAMCKLSHKYYLSARFADLAYSSPYYLKDFFTGPVSTKF